MESGLLSLKAELHKKRTELKQRASNEDVSLHVVKPFPRVEKEKTSHSHKKTKSDKRKVEISEEERQKLSKSRLILEQKASLYEKLKGGTQVLENDELNNKFLVNFQKKIREDVANKSESSSKKKTESEETSVRNYSVCDPLEDENEMVEYIDSFGRTKTCPKRDLETVESRNLKEKSVRIELSETQKKTVENLHQRWFGEEEDAANKDKLHYQDLLFNEARTHGAGFMKFSRDETEREAQQEELRMLRKETIKAELQKKKVDKEKKNRMAERLAKVRQRKRLKMGLPCSDPMEQRLKTPPPSDDSDEEEKLKKNVENKMRELEEAREKDLKEKAAKMREWDIGKIDNVGKLLTQEQWLDKKRLERNEEFAPPIVDGGKNINHGGSRCKINSATVKTSNINQRIQNPNISNVDVSPSSTCKNYDLSGKQTHRPSWKFEKNTSNSAYSIDQNKKIDDCDEVRNFNYAPPSTYEYYGPSSRKKRKNKDSNSTKSSLEEAISKGLANLRKAS